MENHNRQRVLTASAMAGLLAFGVLGGPSQAADGNAKEEKVHCYGVNKCKGTGGCAGAGHACAGKNACKGQGFVELDKDDCLRMKDGRLTADE